MPPGPPKLFRTWPTVASPQAQKRLDDDAQMMMWLMGLARQGKPEAPEDREPGPEKDGGVLQEPQQGWAPQHQPAAGREQNPHLFQGLMYKPPGYNGLLDSDPNELPPPPAYLQGGLGAGADWRDDFSPGGFGKTPQPFGDAARESLDPQRGQPLFNPPPVKPETPEFRPPEFPLSGIRQPAAPGNSEDSQPAGGREPPAGQIVVLPDGSRVPDPDSPMGFMMSPVADLGHVAAAGRETASTSLMQAFNPETAGGASISPYVSLFAHLHQGGTFDYQREGNPITGFKQMPQFRAVSNFNIGLFAQQAGFSLGETLSMAGLYARTFSSNARPDKSYGLDERNTEFIKAGYNAGKSGVFGQTPTP